MIEITDVEESMLPRIAELERQCFSLPWTVGALRSQLTPGHIFLAAVESEGRAPLLLGYVGLMHVLDEGYINNVAVDPSFRRRGIAGALLDALEARCRALSLAFATLEVRAGNTPAIALYQKHGYRAVGKRKNYYEKPVEDAVIMTLEMRYDRSNRAEDSDNTGNESSL